MTAIASPLRSLIPEGLAFGDPHTAGPLTVFPLFGPAPRLEYRSFAEAAFQGFVVKELESGANVNTLLAENKLDVGVLLYEGEEVVGAQQDRTLDVTVLVGAGARIKIPVSCVEAHRWDGRRHGEAFRPSPRAAFPALRASKNRVSRAAMAAGLEARADQGAVWREVAEKADRMGAASATGAMGDIYEDRNDSLESLRGAFSRADGQIGMLACLDGRPTVLDLVSRADVFASLFEPLLNGYCLDALDRPTTDAAGIPAAPEVAGEFLEAVCSAGAQRARAVGAGENLVFTGAKVGGTGLAVGDELVQLTAFAEDNGRSARILRPSRRR